MRSKRGFSGSTVSVRLVGTLSRSPNASKPSVHHLPACPAISISVNSTLHPWTGNEQPGIGFSFAPRGISDRTYFDVSNFRSHRVFVTARSSVFTPEMVHGHL